MMILRSTPPSPFGRKVLIAASLLGLSREIELRGVDLDDAADSVRVQNPIGKIPVLIVEDGATYYDSRVILEYLDYRAGGGRIIPREAPARFETLRLQALCDGILDACLLLIYEGRYRPVRQARAALGRSPGRQGRARHEGARASAAADRPGTRRRPDHARLPARLSRSSFRRHLAARNIRGWSRGTTSSPRRCRPSARPKSSRKTSAVHDVMMILRSTTTSPFGRKARIAALVLGLEGPDRAARGRSR